MICDLYRLEMGLWGLKLLMAVNILLGVMVIGVVFRLWGYLLFYITMLDRHNL